MKLDLIKSNEKGETYQADGFEILYRHKGVVAGDNSENAEELVYLISGKAEITITNKIEVFKSPAKIKIPAKTYHKIKALTDIAFILWKL